jgi:hypothetical protein
MSGDNWNPWKAAVVGIAVVVTTVLVTAAVVGNWNSNEATKSAPVASKRTARQVATAAVPSSPDRTAAPNP